jgi:hypothetical protein
MNKIILYTGLLILILFSAGCVKVDEEFSELRNNVMTSFGDNYETEYQFSVGTIGITVSSWLVDFAQDEEYVDDMMREIDNVQVGIYKKIIDSYEPGYNTLKQINDDMEKRGWKYILRSVDNGDFISIYIRSGSENFFNQLYIVSFDDEQLILLDIEGDLKEVIATVIEEKGLDFDSIAY